MPPAASVPSSRSSDLPRTAPCKSAAPLGTPCGPPWAVPVGPPFGVTDLQFETGCKVEKYVLEEMAGLVRQSQTTRSSDSTATWAPPHSGSQCGALTVACAFTSLEFGSASVNARLQDQLAFPHRKAPSCCREMARIAAMPSFRGHCLPRPSDTPYWSHAQATREPCDRPVASQGGVSKAGPRGQGGDLLGGCHPAPFHCGTVPIRRAGVPAQGGNVCCCSFQCVRRLSDRQLLEA